MKTRELIEKLQEIDPDGDGEVHFAYNYGDYWRTTVAPEVTKICLEIVHHSEYHSLPAISDGEHRHDDDVEVIVLR